MFQLQEFFLYLFEMEIYREKMAKNWQMYTEFYPIEKFLWKFILLEKNTFCTIWLCLLEIANYMGNIFWKLRNLYKKLSEEENFLIFV